VTALEVAVWEVADMKVVIGGGGSDGADGDWLTSGGHRDGERM